MEKTRSVRSRIVPPGSRFRGRYRVRDGDGLLGCGLAVEKGLQLLPHLEIGNLLRGHVDLLPRLRVATLARGAIAEAEAAKAADLHLLSGLEGVDDTLQGGLDDDPGLDLRNVQL